MSIRYYEINLNEIVSKARRILEKHVKIAVLYGSATRRKLVRDIDIAVYMEPEPTLKQLLILEAKLEREIKIPVELRLITHLHPETAYKALTRGENVPKSGVPETFFVLSKELQALGLDVEIYKEANKDDK